MRNRIAISSSKTCIGLKQFALSLLLSVLLLGAGLAVELHDCTHEGGDASRCIVCNFAHTFFENSSYSPPVIAENVAPISPVFRDVLPDSPCLSYSDSRAPPVL